MNPFAILPIIAFAVILVVWSYILGQRKRDPVNRAFLLFSGFCGIWLCIHLLFYIPSVWGIHKPLYIIQAFFWIPCGFLFLNFAYALVGRQRDRFYNVGLFLTVFLVVLHLDADLFISGYKKLDWGIIQIYRGAKFGSLYTLAALQMAFYAGAGLILINRKRRNSTNPDEKKILNLILVGGIITIITSFTANITIPVFLGLPNHPKYGSSMMVILIFVVFLAVRKYQFLSMSVESVANTLFDDINEGVLLVGTNNVVDRENHALKDMIGKSALGKTVEEILPGIDIENDVVDQTATVETKRGRKILSVSSSTSSRSGIQIGKIVIIRDITRQKEAEAVLQRSKDDLEKEVKARTAELHHAQRMEAIGTFAGAIAHDFNNFLAAILGFANAAKNEVSIASPAYTDLTEVITAGRRAREIIRKLLTFSRTDRDLEFKSIAIGDILKETAALVRVSLPSNIKIQYDIDKCNAFVRCDPVQLTQLFMNLSANSFYALRNSENGRFTIGTEDVVVDTKLAKRTPPLRPGPHVKITVEDNGHGMDSQIQERIFDPFFTTKPMGEGTGLGLSTSLGIVRNHGGAILVDSTPNKGTTFTIYLPTITEPPLRESRETVQTFGGKERVLVVDDEEQMGRLLIRQLTPLGYQVTTQISSRIALKMIEQNNSKFDIILSDFTMPELSGLKLAKAIRRICPKIPIILMSGYGEALEKVDLHAIGVHTLLQKPIAIKELSQAIRSALRSNQSLSV